MSKALMIGIASALIVAGVMSHSRIASAGPVTDALAIKNAVPNNLEAVRYRGGRHHGGGRHGHRGGRRWHGGGWSGFGAGLAAGAIIGGVIAAPYYYETPYYYSGPRYYIEDPGIDAEEYCIRRYRSYDPYSGTYLGYDGYRHPCP